ncbi:hypothetical protein EDD11_004076 [Mortierella claussenii]|nr:hypothetical protein EDD11_004076 [Mortierella claussenii]
MASEKASQAWFKHRGWRFNENNDFVDKDGNLFDFESDGEHYEFVHGMIKNHINMELRDHYGFVQYPVPSRKRSRSATLIDLADDPLCPQVFVTKDVMLNPNLLVIVQGLGEVPPGQWARKLFTNGKKDQWRLATQFPYIERARHLGWAVVLCDPNRNEGRAKTRMSRARHVQRVWEEIVRKSRAKCVMYVGFSAGTFATLDLYESKSNDHDSVPGTAVGHVFEFLQESVHWFECTLTQTELDEYRGSYMTVSETTGISLITTWPQSLGAIKVAQETTRLGGVLDRVLVL